MDKDMKVFGIIVTLVSFGLLIGVALLAGNSTVTPESKTKAINVDQQDWIYGKTDAKVILVEYLDFECEACASSFPMVQKIKEEYKDKIQFVVRYFPLDGHKSSRPAAYAVEAAGQQGKFWEMYEIVFQKQTEWSTSQNVEQTLEGYAVSLGLNVEKYRIDVRSDTTKDRISKDLNSGKLLDIQGTPTFFLDGKKIRTPSNIANFKLLLDEEISKSISE
jgi:protein-disulfide isomerase